MKTDLTFSDESRFGSTLWVATRLGMTVNTYHRRCKSLVEAGFPRRDPLTNLYPKDDVDAWINARHKSHVTLRVEGKQGINLDGI